MDAKKEQALFDQDEPAKDRDYYARLLGIEEIVNDPSKSADEVSEAFRIAMADYLEFSAEIGKKIGEEWTAVEWAMFRASRETHWRHSINIPWEEIRESMDLRGIKKPEDFGMEYQTE